MDCFVPTAPIASYLYLLSPPPRRVPWHFDTLAASSKRGRCGTVVKLTLVLGVSGSRVCQSSGRHQQHFSQRRQRVSDVRRTMTVDSILLLCR